MKRVSTTLLICDRDISEVVSATLNENLTGRSTAKTSGFGFGWGSAVMGVFQGGTYGGLMGISGGKSKASSTASQSSQRDSTANSFQSIRDRTTQVANAVRSQRSTVIQTVTRGGVLQDLLSGARILHLGTERESLAAL